MYPQLKVSCWPDIKDRVKWFHHVHVHVHVHIHVHVHVHSEWHAN